MLSRVAVFLGLAAAGCGLDLLTKHWFFDRYYGQPLAPHEAHWWLWDGVLGIQTSTNQGALFGIGQGGSWFFAGLSVLACVGILIWLFGFGAARDWGLTVPLGLITGGILGNLYDRLGLWHGSDAAAYDRFGVRDWIHFRWEGMPGFDPWPNFNLADSWLVVGAAILFVHLFRAEQSVGGLESKDSAGTEPSEAVKS